MKSNSEFPPRIAEPSLGNGEVSSLPTPEPSIDVERLCRDWGPQLIEDFNLRYFARGDATSEFITVIPISRSLPARVAFDVILISEGGHCSNLARRNPRWLVGRSTVLAGGYTVVISDAGEMTRGEYRSPLRVVGITRAKVIFSITEIELTCDVYPPSVRRYAYYSEPMPNADLSDQPTTRTP